MNAIEFDHVGKQYRLGLVSTGTFSDDLTRWWTMHVRHKADPFLKIGETNDRSQKGNSNYVWALKDINFNVEQGDVVGIIGKNGAGKSTLLKLLSRVTTPTVGEIRARGRIASLMTKQEITRKLDEIVDFSGCERYIDTPVKRYSSGMTVRLGFAIAAHLEPEILVVDEVLAVGDAEFQKKAIGKMQDVSKGEGRTVLFVSHNMDSMLNLCQKGVLLENGSVKYMGDIRSTVSEYLGGDNDNKFIQKNPQSPLFVSTVFFTGTHENQSGLFNFDEDITFTVVIKKDVDLKVDKNAVMSVILMTANRTRICNYEMPIGDMQESERTIQFRYKSKTLLPNTYLIRVVMHIPNVQFYDRQDTCSFKVSDNGTEFLKYNGTDNGLIIYTPDVNM